MNRDKDGAVTCPACGTRITESAQALAPELRDVLPDMRFHVWVCPRCGCENYEVETSS